MGDRLFQDTNSYIITIVIKERINEEDHHYYYNYYIYDDYDGDDHDYDGDDPDYDGDDPDYDDDDHGYYDHYNLASPADNLTFHMLDEHMGLTLSMRLYFQSIFNVKLSFCT